MTERQRDETGRFERDLSDTDILSAVEETDTPTTTDIADELGCDRTSARYRLGLLEDAGEVTSKKVGPAVVWRVVD